ncbi:MAG: methyl-accepting chemotaxis protein [bacterium]
MFKSIKAQLICATVLTCFISIILTVSVNFALIKKTVVYETLNGFEQETAKESEFINGWLKEQKVIIDTIAKSISAINTTESTVIMPILKEEINGKSHYVDLYTINENSIGNFSSGYILPSTYDVTTRGWYQDTISNPYIPVISDPYVDVSTGSTVITISKYIGIIDGVKVVLGADIQIDELIDVLTTIVTKDNSYATLLNSSGDIIAHTIGSFQPVDGVMSNISSYPSYNSLHSAISSNNLEPSILVTDYDNIDRYLNTAPIEETGWYIVYAIPESIIMADLYNLIHVTIIIVAIALALSGLVNYIIAVKLISNPIKSIQNAAEKLVSGDLDFNMASSNSTSNKNELDQLQDSFMEVQAIIQKLINDLNKMSNEQYKGIMDSKLNEQEFKGAYQEVAVGVNKMTFNTIDIIQQMSYCLDRFSKGDFTDKLKELPGEQINITNVINSLGQNLQDVSNEISYLAENASKGELHARTNSEEYHGDWKILLEKLNYLMEAVSVPIEETSKVISEISQGNLQLTVQGDYEGSFNDIKIKLNNTVNELSSYIKEITKALEGLANKDLTVKISRPYLGEFINIRNSINHIGENLTTVFEKIQDATNQVHDGAIQVSNTSNELSVGAQLQVTSIEALSNAVEKINSQASLSAENATNADNLSVTSKQIALTGGKEMDTMVIAMKQINESSNSISNVLGVIEDIAFQTNILALNAAVEAARAGEQGKGFAVVAEEVRSLANRSQQAAHQSTEYIEASNMKIKDGVKIADTTNGILNEIVKSIADVSDLITDISNSVGSQANSVVEIMDELTQISNIAQSNTATSEESAASAEELSNQADLLSSLVSEFKI